MQTKQTENNTMFDFKTMCKQMASSKLEAIRKPVLNDKQQQQQQQQ